MEEESKNELENEKQENLKVDLESTIELKDQPFKDESEKKSAPMLSEVGEKTSLRTMRTYKDDITQVMEKKKESLVSIATAENKRRIKSKGFEPDDGELKRKNLKKVGIVILSTILFVFGASSAFYFYEKSGTKAVEPESKIPSIIFSDEEEEFEITNLSRRQILSELTALKESTRLSIGRINNIFITESFIGEDGVETKGLVNAGNFLNAIDAHLPASFLRSLERDFMFGIHIFNNNHPFLILRTSFYENAFAGMLVWEENIKEDLAPLFGSADFEVISDESAETNISPLVIPIFSDFVVKNKDTRILKDGEGKTVIMYSFIDKNTIVITTNENTFSEIFTRLSSSRTLQ